MTPYTLTQGFVTPEQLGLFKYISHVLEKTPDVMWGECIPSCHHVCHALAKAFPIVHVETGHFGKGEPHSWLEFAPSLQAARADPRARVIADMYPVAGAAPLLVYTYFITTWAKFYIPDPSVMSEVTQEDPLFHLHIEDLATCFRAF